MSDIIETFPVKHPVHGAAKCDERQWPEFEAAGWTRPEPKDESKSEPKKGGK